MVNFIEYSLEIIVMNLNVFVIVMIMMTERDRELLYSGFRDHARLGKWN